jgi:hypothetical protein
MIKKTIIGIILLITLGSFKINAQKMTFGCKAGFDLAYITQETTQDYPPSLNKHNYQLRPSFDFGVLINYQIINKLQVQIEPGLTEKGTTRVFNNHPFGEIYGLGYLNMPVTIIFKPIQRINIEAGTEFGYLIDKKNMEQSPFTGANGPVRFKKFEMSGFYGLAINPFGKFYLTFRYTEAFTPFLYKAMYPDPNPGPSYFFKYYNKYYSIGTRYFFGKKVTPAQPIIKKNKCLEPYPKRKQNKYIATHNTDNKGYKTYHGFCKPFPDLKRTRYKGTSP